MDLQKLRAPKEAALASVRLFVTVVVVALLLRVVFMLFGAEAGNEGFVNWLYGTTDVMLEPVRGVFPSGEANGQFVLDVVGLFGVVAYTSVGAVVMGLVERWGTKLK